MAGARTSSHAGVQTTASTHPLAGCKRTELPPCHVCVLQVIELGQVGLGRGQWQDAPAMQFYAHTQRGGGGFGDASALVHALQAAADNSSGVCLRPHASHQRAGLLFSLHGQRHARLA